VIVRNCVVYQAHGGFVIGSEMSGGARNLFVSDCTFIGTDIGLRFKTTRGRGGVVENIHVKNINMKDIVGEAILFDMYYAAVDPVPLVGEKRDAPKVVVIPVTEKTPQFKDFYISNVVSNGSEKAIFVRGLPEMSIKNINLTDMVLKADKGIEIIEGENINLKNVKVEVKDASPLVLINNSKNISFDKMSYDQEVPVLFNVQGEKTSNIKVTNTSTTKAIAKTEFGLGAKKQAIQIK
jgi:polygalacturonase